MGSRRRCALQDARKTDPQADVVREATLNRLGYRLLRGNNGRDSVLAFWEIVGWYPGSSNACDSLAEALETLGERQQAIDVTREALEVLAGQQLTDEQRKQMADVLQARLVRLQWTPAAASVRQGPAQDRRQVEA